MSQLDIKIRKLQDNGSTFRANIETLYLGGVRSAKVDRLHFEVPEEWKACTISLHVKRLSGTLPDPQILDENNSALVDRRWTLEKEGTWMLLAINDSGYIAMTKPGKYTCYDTIDTDTTTENITPSIYEQFVAEVTKYAKQALESMNAAKTSETNAKTSETNAKASADKAKASADSMDASVATCTTKAGEASTSAGAAATSRQAAEKAQKAAEDAAALAGTRAGTDKTLSVPDAPADAKTVGDKFKSIKTDWNSVTDKPSTFPPSAHNHSKLEFENKNEVNFVGIPENNTVYLGYRDNTIDEYRFNDGRGSGSFANVRANKFIGSLDGNATTATKATGVTDYKDASRTIQVGYAGDGLNTSNLTHIAGYTDNGTKIKDVNKSVMQSWLGVTTITSQTSDPGAGSSLATGTILLVYA